MRGGDEESFGGDGYAMLIVAMVSWVDIYVKMYQIIHFKYGQFSVCQLYVKKAVFKISFLVPFRMCHIVFNTHILL